MTPTLAAIHLAKKRLGLDDDTYRAKLTNITGKSSAKDMSEAERKKVLSVFRKEGFPSQKVNRCPNGSHKLTGKFAKKLQALWIAAWNLGIVRDREDAALVAFVKRQTGLDHMRFLHYAGDARRAIEGLKGWMTRQAGVDWADAAIMPDYARSDGFKIAWAQWRLLGGNVHADSVNRFREKVLSIAGHAVDDCQPKDWQSVMNELGFLIRAARDGAHG